MSKMSSIKIIHNYRINRMNFRFLIYKESVVYPEEAEFLFIPRIAAKYENDEGIHILSILSGYILSKLGSKHPLLCNNKNRNDKTIVVELWCLEKLVLSSEQHSVSLKGYYKIKI